MAKLEADGLKKVSVSFLKKHGYLKNSWASGTMTWSRNGTKTGCVGIQSVIRDDEKYIRFYYTQTDRSTGDIEDFDYQIPLVTTPCYFGGFRYWFQCPWYTNGTYCGRRVGVLYLGDKHFACRHCHHLTYESRNVSNFEKAIGHIFSADELDEMHDRIKRKSYAGKMTKRYRKYLNKSERAFCQIMLVSKGLYATKRLEKT
jgi:hypothetical protein